MPTVAVSPSSSTHSWSLVKRMRRALSGSGGGAVIAMGGEGKGGDLRGLRPAADDDLKRGPGRRKGGRGVAHGDGRSEGRRKAAAGDDPDLPAVAVGNRR